MCGVLGIDGTELEGEEFMHILEIDRGSEAEEQFVDRHLIPTLAAEVARTEGLTGTAQLGIDPVMTVVDSQKEFGNYGIVGKLGGCHTVAIGIRPIVHILQLIKRSSRKSESSVIQSVAHAPAAIPSTSGIMLPLSGCQS